MATSYETLGRESPAGLGEYGVILACLAGNFVCATPMLNSTFSLFLIPMADEFAWARSAVSLGLFVVAVVGVLAYPLAGRLADRFGVRRVVLWGNILFGVSLCALSRVAPTALSFYGTFLIIGLSATLCSTVLYAKVVAAWFNERRGLVLGLTAGVGNSLGSTVMPVFAASLIAGFGWRNAYVGLGLATIGIGFPVLTTLLRDRPGVTLPDHVKTDAQVGDGVDLAVAVRRVEYWILLGAIGMGAGALTALFGHVIPILLDRGMTIGVATMTLVVFAFTCMFWQIAFGWLLDRIQDPRLAMPFFLLPIAGAWLLITANGVPALIFGSMLMGLGLGTEYSLLPYWVPRYFGRRAYGAIYGSIYGVIALAMGLLPVLMDLSFDLSGDYRISIFAISTALAAGALLVTLLRPYRYSRAGEPVAC